MSVRHFFVCPLCGRDFHGEVPELVKRVGVFVRDVWFGSHGRGRGVIKLLRVTRAKDVQTGTWLTEVRGAVLALAHLLGFELSAETVGQVVKDYTVHQGRKRIRTFSQRAHAAYAKRGDGRQVGRVRRAKGRGRDLGQVVGSWDVNTDTIEGQGQDLGEVVGSWK